jgi:pimeloyl-ACP methyl ester carboxylesterase
MNGKKNFLPLCWLFPLGIFLNGPRAALAQPTMQNRSSESIQVNGTELHYIEEGKGRPVVFVHGSFGDYRTWHYQMEPFSGNYRAISYSRRYYYPNAPSTPSSMHSSRLDADDLAAFIQALHAGPVHLVGHSVGAYIALVVAIKHPGLVKDLVLGEPPVWELIAGDSLGQALMKKAMADAFVPAVKAFKNNEDKKAAGIFLDGVVGKERFIQNLPPVDRKIMTDEIATEKNIFLSEGDPEYQPPFTEADIRDMTIPVLLVSGADTPRWLAHLTDRLEMYLQNKERVILPNTSHGLEFTSPEAFNKAVLEFIDRQENKSR